MFWKIVGILFALLFAYGGVYCLKNPADGNGPLGIGLFGIAILFAPKGSNPAAGFVLSGVFILIAVVWHLSYREQRDEQNSWKELPTNKANGNRKSFGHLKGAKTIAR